MDKIATHIQGAVGKKEEKYVFNIYYTPKLKINDISSLKNFVIDKLKTIPSGQKLPIKFAFPSDKHVLAEIEIFGKPNKLPYGYLGAFMPSEAFTIPSGKEIRRKISKKIAQLPRNKACVIVIEGQIFVKEDGVLDALYGDENVIINLQDNSAHTVRAHNGTFSPKINTRLSAVIFFRKKMG